MQVLSRDPAAADLTTRDIQIIAEKTAGLSGSDLHELCRAAAFGQVRELIEDQGSAGGDSGTGTEEGGQSYKLRKLILSDFVQVLTNAPTTQQQAKACVRIALSQQSGQLHTMVICRVQVQHRDDCQRCESQ
eukprot:COSAG05_NODE_2713_length_2739_cov_2.401136_6_plen_132_part_00